MSCSPSTTFRTEAKQAKIREVTEYIEERLAELEAEKEELKEFQEKDKERRCLEYSLYQAELSEIVEALEEVPMMNLPHFSLGKLTRRLIPARGRTEAGGCNCRTAAEGVQ